eukprot:344846-Amphidinium_carterae.2
MATQAPCTLMGQDRGRVLGLPGTTKDDPRLSLISSSKTNAVQFKLFCTPMLTHSSPDLPSMMPLHSYADSLIT